MPLGLYRAREVSSGSSGGANVRSFESSRPGFGQPSRTAEVFVAEKDGGIPGNDEDVIHNDGEGGKDGEG